jgi:hypothetical protein
MTDSTREGRNNGEITQITPGATLRHVSTPSTMLYDDVLVVCGRDDGLKWTVSETRSPIKALLDE